MNKDSLYHDMASDNIFLLKYFRISRTFAFGSKDLASTVSYPTLLRRHHSCSKSKTLHHHYHAIFGSLHYSQVLYFD